MQKPTSDDIACEIDRALRARTDWFVQRSCSGENAHLQIVAGGESFIVYVAPLFPVQTEEERRAAAALWNQIKKRILEEQK